MAAKKKTTKKPAAKKAAKKPAAIPALPVAAKVRAVFHDAAGARVLGPYDDATSFRDGYAGVRIGDAWGVIDTRGNVVVAPRFAALGELGGGMVAVRDRSKVGYIDCTTDAWAIEPRFDFALGFRGDHASVVTGGEIPEWAKLFQTQPSGGAWGIIDRSGQLVVAMEHGSAHALDGVALVNHGGRAAGIGEITIGGRFRHVDLATRKRIGKTYAGASPMSEGRACVLHDGNSTTWTIIDRGGATIRAVDLKTSATPGPFRSGRAPINRDGSSKTRTKYALIDADGEVILDDLGEALDLDDGVNVINRGGEKVQGECRGGAWGFYSLDNTFVTDRSWLDVRSFREGRGIVMTAAGFTIVDRAGKTIWQSPHLVFPYANGLALVRAPA